MTTQSYLIIENNVVTNHVMWDGGPDWTPPPGSIALEQATTPAMLWEPVTINSKVTHRLTEVIGAGDIGFTWNGTVLITNQPQPADPVQPKASGTQTL